MDDKNATTGLDVGRQIPARRHDAGSGANETPDGLDASNEALRDAVEDAPTNTSSTDIELVPVFDRAHRVPKI
jgi:hypothetical protein